MDAGRTLATRFVVTLLVAASMVAGFLVVVTFIGRGGGAAEEAPVYLEATQQSGVNPFVPVAKVAPQQQAPDSPGSPGSGDLGQCDPERLIAYLTTHRDAAEAWISALNADATLTWSGGRQVSLAQIPDYIRELSAIVLTGDRRVTNYQFVNGTAVSVQSVLQTNTAVLVDRSGVPRVRCACGNPLTPMHQITAPPKYVGKAWSGFTPVVVVVIVDRSTRCDDDEYYDGYRCRRYVDCPESMYLGSDGRCYDKVDPCPDEWLRDSDGRCYDPYPEYCPNGFVKRPGVDCVDLPVCSNGSPREGGKECPPPESCPGGSPKPLDADCPSNPPDPPCPNEQQAGGGCPDKPTCLDGSPQEEGKECPPNPPLTPTVDGPCPAGSVRPVGGECAAVAPPVDELCLDGSVRPAGAECPVTPSTQPLVCPDGSVAPAGLACSAVLPTTVVVPPTEVQQPQVCSDGSVAPAGGQCPVEVPSEPLQPEPPQSEPPQSQDVCSDGSIREQGAECPAA